MEKAKCSSSSPAKDRTKSVNLQFLHFLAGSVGTYSGSVCLDT